MFPVRAMVGVSGAFGLAGVGGEENPVLDLLSPMHLVVLFIIVLLIFGPKRLPELGKGLGQTLRLFRDAQAGKLDDRDQTHVVPVSEDLQRPEMYSDVK